MTARILGNISSVLTRPADTTAYSANDLIASSTTAGSVVVPSFIIPRDDAIGLEIVGGRFYTDLITGFTTAQLHFDLWDAPPTFTNGDNGAYAIATGAAHWLGHLTSDVSSAYNVSGDGAFLNVLCGETLADDQYSREHIYIARGPGQKLYWTCQDLVGFTPASGQKFTLVIACYQEPAS